MQSRLQCSQACPLISRPMSFWVTFANFILSFFRFPNSSNMCSIVFCILEILKHIFLQSSCSLNPVNFQYSKTCHIVCLSYSYQISRSYLVFSEKSEKRQAYTSTLSSAFLIPSISTFSAPVSRSLKCCIWFFCFLIFVHGIIHSINTLSCPICNLLGSMAAIITIFKFQIKSFIFLRRVPLRCHECHPSLQQRWIACQIMF